MIKIEGEHNELILKNEAGDIVIIPANKRDWIKNKIKDKCYDCIDKYVNTLPLLNNYAQDGTVISDGSVLLNPVEIVDEKPEWKKLKDTYLNLYKKENDFEKTYKPNSYIKRFKPDRYKALQEQYNQKAERFANNKVAEWFINENPNFLSNVQSYNNRVKTINSIPSELLNVLKNSDYANKMELPFMKQLESAFLSIGNAASPVEFKPNYVTEEEQKSTTPLTPIFTAASIPYNVTVGKIASDIEGGPSYPLTDALSGISPPIQKEGLPIVADPLNLVGLGIWNKLSEAKLFNKLEDVYLSIKGLNKETAFKKLNNILSFSIADNPEELNVVKHYIDLTDEEFLKLEKYLQDTYNYNSLTPYQKKQLLDREIAYIVHSSVDERIQQNDALLSLWENYKEEMTDYFNSSKFKERAYKQNPDWDQEDDYDFKHFKDKLLKNLENRPYIRPDIINDEAAHYKPKSKYGIEYDQHKGGHSYFSEKYASNKNTVWHEGRHQLTNAEDDVIYKFPSEEEIINNLKHPSLLDFDEDLNKVVTKGKIGKDYYLTSSEFMVRLDELKRELKKVGYDYKTMDLTPEILKKYTGLTPRESIQIVTGKEKMAFSDLTDEQKTKVEELVFNNPKKTEATRLLLKLFKPEFLIDQINNKWAILPFSLIANQYLQEQNNKNNQ